MIQKTGRFSIISGVLTIALCGGCGLFVFKKPVQSIPPKPAATEIVQATEVSSAKQ